MMAPDSSVPPLAPFPGETLDTLRIALVSYVRNGESDADIRDALQQLAGDARARAIQPEEVLVHLKRVWASIPLTETQTTPVQNAHALQRVVTMCIKEYFR